MVKIISKIFVFSLCYIFVISCRAEKKVKRVGGAATGATDSPSTITDESPLPADQPDIDNNTVTVDGGLDDTTPPLVDAGPDILTNGVAVIDASSSDSQSMTYSWTKTSGPGSVTFATGSAEDTTAITSMDGTYVLRLTVTDANGNSAFDELTLVSLWRESAKDVS